MVEYESEVFSESKNLNDMEKCSGIRETVDDMPDQESRSKVLSHEGTKNVTEMVEHQDMDNVKREACSNSMQVNIERENLSLITGKLCLVANEVEYNGGSQTVDEMMQDIVPNKGICSSQTLSNIEDEIVLVGDRDGSLTCTLIEGSKDSVLGNVEIACKSPNCEKQTQTALSNEVILFSTVQNVKENDNFVGKDEDEIVYHSLRKVFNNHETDIAFKSRNLDVTTQDPTSKKVIHFSNVQNVIGNKKVLNFRGKSFGKPYFYDENLHLNEYDRDNGKEYKEIQQNVLRSVFRNHNKKMGSSLKCEKFYDDFKSKRNRELQFVNTRIDSSYEHYLPEKHFIFDLDPKVNLQDPYNTSNPWIEERTVIFSEINGSILGRNVAFKKSEKNDKRKKNASEVCGRSFDYKNICPNGGKSGNLWKDSKSMEKNHLEKNRRQNEVEVVSNARQTFERMRNTKKLGRTYTRSELEALRFVNSDEQKKKWDALCLRLERFIVQELDEMVATDIRKNVNRKRRSGKKKVASITQRMEEGKERTSCKSVCSKEWSEGICRSHIPSILVQNL